MLPLASYDRHDLIIGCKLASAYISFIANNWRDRWPEHLAYIKSNDALVYNISLFRDPTRIFTGNVPVGMLKEIKSSFKTS